MALKSTIKRWQRRLRRAFPSPAEARFAQLMGAWVITLPLRNSKGFKLAVIVPGGWYKANYIEREIPVWGYSIDFGNRATHLGIEIDGRNYHNIVDDQRRDEHLAKHGWLVKRVPAARLWHEPRHVRKEVKKFMR